MAAMREWSEEELRLLDKAQSKFPTVRAHACRQHAHPQCGNRAVQNVLQRSVCLAWHGTVRPARSGMHRACAR